MYKAFGVVSGSREKVNVIEQPDVEFPEAEVTGGVSYIKVSTSGDVPSEVFVEVTAVSSAQAVAVYEHVAESVRHTVAGWWTATSGEQGAEK